MRMLRKIGPLAVALAVLGGCALTSHPRIADIKYNPGRYKNRNVTVNGVVTSAWGFPMLPFKLYKVSDGTGEVTVLSNSGRVPTRGARVSVEGRVEDMASLGGQSVGLHIREQHVRIKW